MTGPNGGVVRLNRMEVMQHVQRGFRFAGLPLIAMFANISVPTQAALPEHSAIEWTRSINGELTDIRLMPQGGAIMQSPGDQPRVNRDAKSARPVAPNPDAARQPRITYDPAKIGRWWVFRRALPADPFAGPGNPDLAVVRGFPIDEQRGRFAGAPAVPEEFVTHGGTVAHRVAYAPDAPRQLIWSPLIADPVVEGLEIASVRPLRKGDHKWMSRPLPATAVTVKEQRCLATAIYFEARGESKEGQAAVAQVILNRVRNPAYPDTICGVVYQNANLRNRCQFSFACDGVAEKIRARRAYERAQKIARKVTAGEIFIAKVGASTHYFADYVRPRWANRMIKTASIGEHHFFTTRKGGWQ